MHGINYLYILFAEFHAWNSYIMAANWLKLDSLNHTNSSSQQVPVLFWLLVFLSLSICQGQITCHHEHVTEPAHWRNGSKFFVVPWLIEKVCSSHEECYGIPSGTNEKDHLFDQVQLCPVEVQTGDQVTLITPAEESFFTLKPVNVSADIWETCPSSSYPSEQILYNSSNLNANISLPERFLLPGVVYIAQIRNGFISDCELGLRVQILVKDNLCYESENGSFCSGHGDCVSHIKEPHYTCLCETSFTGMYCDEYNACITAPCKNGGTCVDHNEGIFGTNFSCQCSEESAGEFTDIEKQFLI